MQSAALNAKDSHARESPLANTVDRGRDVILRWRGPWSRRRPLAPLRRWSSIPIGRWPLSPFRRWSSIPIGWWPLSPLRRWSSIPIGWWPLAPFWWRSCIPIGWWSLAPLRWWPSVPVGRWSLVPLRWWSRPPSGPFPRGPCSLGGSHARPAVGASFLDVPHHRSAAWTDEQSWRQCLWPLGVSIGDRKDIILGCGRSALEDVAQTHDPADDQAHQQGSNEGGYAYG